MLKRLAELTDVRTVQQDNGSVNVYVGSLRKKLSGDIIETVRGAGYRLRGKRRQPQLDGEVVAFNDNKLPK